MECFLLRKEKYSDNFFVFFSTFFFFTFFRVAKVIFIDKMIYTPAQFLFAFISLIRTHTNVELVRIVRLSQRKTAGATSSSQIQESQSSHTTLELIEIEVQFLCSMAGENFSASRALTVGQKVQQNTSAIARDEKELEMKGARVTASYRIVGSQQSITPQWCAKLQRLLSTVVLLSHPTEVTAACSVSRKGEVSSQSSFLSDVERCCSKKMIFQVHLPGVLVPMTWEAQYDGFFGSHFHACVHHRVNRLPSFHSAAPRSSLKPVKTGSLDAGADLSCEDLGADAGEEAVCVTSPDERPLRALGEPSVGESILFRKGTVDVGVVVNASLGIPKASMDPSVEALGGFHVLVLHAADTKLCTIDIPASPTRPIVPSEYVTSSTNTSCSASLQDSGARSSSPALSLFEFMKSFTCHYIISHVSLGSINASWKLKRETFAADSPCASSQPTKHRIERVVEVSEASGLGALGTHFLAAFETCERADAGRAVHNIVFVVNIPLSMWETLYSTAAHSSTDLYNGIAEDSLASRVGSEIGAAMSSALSHLCAQHMDLFAFTSSAKTIEGDGASAGVSRSSCRYSDDMLQHSISTSIASIIFASPNPLFVKEAERLLFDMPDSDSAENLGQKEDEHEPSYGAAWRKMPSRLPCPAGEEHSASPLARHSFASIRQAIKARLEERSR